MFKSFKILIIIIAILLIFWTWFVYTFVKYLHTPIIAHSEPAVKFILAEHSSDKALIRQLYRRKILKHPQFFLILTYLEGATRKLKAGEYKIEPEETPSQLLAKLVSGKAALHSFTIVPGWTFNRTINQLIKNKYLKHTVENLTAEQIMEKIELSKVHPEGKFYPDTYKFAMGTKDTVILKMAYNLMQKILQELWEERDKSVPYKNSYTALIVASILEKESAIFEERRLIAGLILNRLAKKIYLQMDPTVIYGLGKKFTGKITAENLKDKNPYNTYTHNKLPPTPICMPGRQAIYAALHPIKSDYLYFVARSDGTHEFSKDLKSHNIAVQKHQRQGAE